MMDVTDTALSGQPLRLRLLELFLTHSQDAHQAFDLAVEAEIWVGQGALPSLLPAAKPAAPDAAELPDTAEIALPPHVVSTMDVHEKVVRAMLAEGARVNGSTLAARLECSQWTASSHLRRMERNDILRRDGKGSRVSFVLIDTPITSEQSPVIPICRAPVARGLDSRQRSEQRSVEVRNLLGRADELERWWRAGKLTTALCQHFGVLELALDEALLISGIRDRFPRGVGGIPQYLVVPLDPAEDAASGAALATKRQSFHAPRRPDPVIPKMLSWLRDEGCPVTVNGDSYKIGTTVYDLDGLFSMVNKIRALQELKPFRLETV